LSKTFSSPALQGKIELQNGTYENYFTGTILKEINAEAEALNHQIKLLSLSSKDDGDGLATAEGNLELLPQEKFPYTFQTELCKLHALRFDTVDCYFTGPLYIKGNSQSALAQGNLIAPEANLKIPEELRSDLPVLPITYINKPLHLDLSTLTPLPVFPLNIDLELSAPEKVYVTGKGLNSEWAGNVHLSGTNAQVSAGGKLKLINGEYLFSGKAFKLTEGEITFSDKPDSSGYINLSGTLDLSDIAVTAYLRGSLSSPLLTFQSNPHMSTSSILARILFNKDISDISHPEAIQLANTLISLSGGAAPDVLDAIRRSIGVDRLTIVSARPGTDQIAVQIGKYLVRGVMITLAQSAASSQVIVEVELKQGFIFQAETQEEEEGKFTLKWNKNY
ncbi:MAG TPA: translocation/assembly module TamB domain-containing protein, partial [Syntrophales bacterium]|nr:translocation/assembly module TamB domain-containing protein [Syntrophales bacterium]